MMRVYLAGPMRGYPAYNFPAFDAAAASLRERGYWVFNPAARDRADGFTPGPDDTDNAHPHDFSHYMAIDLAEVCKADAVCVLPGWGASQGATLEVHVARKCGKPVLDAATLEPVPDHDIPGALGQMSLAQAIRHYARDEPPPMRGALPDDSDERKTYPLYRGLFLYFPRALAAIAHHSYVNNEKHNPGEPLHWSRDKSDDHEDAMLRHIVDGDWHGAAWRALAKLELVLEGGGDE